MDDTFKKGSLEQPEFHTPKMSSSPSYHISQRHFSPRTELRKEIGELKYKITVVERSVGGLQEQKGHFVALASSTEGHWGLVESASQEIVAAMKLLSQYEERLATLEKKLEKADEEAEMRARASIGAVQTSNLSTEGPDIAYIPVDGKFRLMKDWLNEEKVLLLRSPPGSGKTTFAMTFTSYLESNGFKATYLNASISCNTPSDTKSMDEIWQAAFASELTFPQTSSQCPSDQVHYVIVDEVQTWYPSNVTNLRAQEEVLRFWADVKFFVKPALKLGDYLFYEALRSIDPPPSTTGVRLLCFAGYGETNVGSIATPLVFVDPEDPMTGLRLPLGLEFLRLDYESAKKLLTRYSEIKALQGKTTYFDAETCDLIYKETNGHVGALRTLLHHLVSSDRRSKQNVLDFIGQVIYQRNLSAFRAFLSVSQDNIERLSSKDRALLVQGIVSYKKGDRDFTVQESQVADLVKLGVFVKTGETAIGITTVAFPSPLHFDLALYNILHRNLRFEQSDGSFEEFIRELVLRMSPKALVDTTPEGLAPLEVRWQDELSKSFRKISTATMGLGVGREFKQRAFLDVYINELQWGVELLRDGSRLAEHVGRFLPGGRYSKIPMKRYAVLNFMNQVPDSAILERYDASVYHLVYSDEFTTVTVHRSGKRTEDWNLIGHQGRTEH